ncbi:iron-sulfur cluster assembly scaffold protein [Candidatus Micrarchaeota archaeon]|nr:iron-sulfur cluster assembly scaffold protein [Candidatus Micrarchaeota archaeon]
MDEIARERIIELYKNPLNFGTIPDADYTAELRNSACGDIIRIYLQVKNNKIIDAKFEGEGCAISMASASLLTDFLKGKTPEEVRNLDKDDIQKILGMDLSRNPSRLRCALLPLETAKKALAGSK